jgi:5-methylcytosine-specific restriction endonuclease McrA
MARKQACDITPKVREIVKARDGHKCVYCGTTYSLQLAHIFINRSHSGLGVEQNLTTLCIACHMSLDNGREEKAKPIRDYCEWYLNSRYEIDLDTLKYKKG